jgi:hypothetical protein
MRGEGVGERAGTRSAFWRRLVRVKWLPLIQICWASAMVGNTFMRLSAGDTAIFCPHWYND